MPKLAAIERLIQGAKAADPRPGIMRQPTHAEDLDMMSDLQAASVRRPNRLATWALGFLGAGFFVFIAAAALVQLDEVTRAEGKVIPSGQNQIVAHLYGGIVEEILVREGDEVKPGQVLLRIDNREAEADFGETKARLGALGARAARLESETAGRPAMLFPPGVEDAAPAAAMRERQLFRARRESLESELKGLEEQTLQREQELKQQESLVSAIEKKLASLKSELATMERAGRANVGRLEVLRLQRETKDAEGELVTERLKIPRIQSSILEARQKSTDRRNVFVSEARKELNDSQSEIARLREKLEKLNFDVGKSEVKAPLRGIVKQLRIATRGGVVKAGEPLVEITPLEDKLVIEARVRPSDIAFLRLGQRALVKITAYNYSTYGGLDGIVTEISPDALEAPEKPGETYFRVKVRTDKGFLVNYGKKLPIGPGMTANVSIKIGEKSLLAYILKPITKSQRSIQIDAPVRPPPPTDSPRPPAASL